jgi:hypothetical protein
MKFPVQPSSPTCSDACVVCHRLLSPQPGVFAFLNGGALREIDDLNADSAADMIGFMSIGMHDDQGATAAVRIADDASMGQFEFYFCSTACLRSFFDKAVDELEHRLTQSHP